MVHVHILLQTDGYLPRQQVAQSTTEDLVPPAPASEALPPIYAAQTFRDKGASAEADYRESSSETEGQEEAQPVSRFKYVNAKDGTHYQVVKHQTEPLANNDRNYSPSTQNNHRDAEDEEVISRNCSWLDTAYRQSGLKNNETR